jgi:hypothetical protein
MDAGITLARLLDMPGVAARLHDLILDPEDTAVTRWTVDALVRRGDGPALAVVADTLPFVDDARLDWIVAGFLDALPLSSDWEAIATACQMLPASNNATMLCDLVASLHSPKPAGLSSTRSGQLPA